MNPGELTAFGLTEAEALIYTTALKIGKGTVKDIAKDSGFHRTNIYDILEQLREKGLISAHNEGKVAIYQASDPKNLYDLLKEKQELLDKLFPELEALHNQTSETIQVEVYKGKEGMKAAFREILRINKPLYAFGVKGQFRQHLPEYAAQWLRDAKQQKMSYYGVYTEKGNEPSHYTEIRYLPKEYSSPVATFIYGDRININIWEPNLVAIVIRSPLVAKMYKQHFDLLWKIAK